MLRSFKLALLTVIALWAQRILTVSPFARLKTPKNFARAGSLYLPAVTLLAIAGEI